MKQGALLLDNKTPDWRNQIDCAILNLDSHRDCVLGQLYESYYVGTKLLKLDDASAIAFGFDAENPSDESEYENLTMEWKQQINGSNS